MTTRHSRPLSRLLDVSGLETPVHISLRFREIAEAILYDYRLRIEFRGHTTDFEFLEIEFYLQKHNIHDDPFCHAHDDQSKAAQWYFHRAPRKTSSPARPSNTPTKAGGYRGGTRKGLDLTFGPPITSSHFPVSQEVSAHCRGGILLRSMRQNGGNGGVVSGPSLLVDKILSITKSRTIAELVATKLGGSISAFPSPSDTASRSDHPAKIYLVPFPRNPSTHLPIIHRSPRIGLDLSHPTVSPQRNNPRVIYFSKLYRYFARPELLKANGRCHTLIGLHLEQAAKVATDNPLQNNSALIHRLMEMTALGRTTIQKYIDDYAEGFANKSLAEYVGTAGKGASSNPKMFMRMMGVLLRMELLTAHD